MKTHASTLVVCAAPAEDVTGFYDRLLGSAEYIVAVDDGASVCLRADRIPDILVGDFDSLDPATADWSAAHGVETLRHPSKKDVTDLDLALEVLRARGLTDVCITAAWSGRLDHTFAALGSACRYADLGIMLRDPGLAGWVLEASRFSRLALGPAGSTVSLVAPLGPAVVSCEGMAYPLERHTLDVLSSRGISNEIVDARAEIRVFDGTICVLSSEVEGVALAHALCW